MYSADMGVAQDVIAHVFVECLPYFQGRSKEERCKQLWLLLQQFYELREVPASFRVQRLRLEDFVRKDKPNKFRGKAAFSRPLVHFLPMLCHLKLPASPWGLAVTSMAEALDECYKLVPQAPCEELKLQCQRFSNAYCACQATVVAAAPTSVHWHIKPKLHLFQELCEYSRRNPRDFWCYRDETFGNIVQEFSRRRGGPDNPGTNCKHLLQSWCCAQEFPRPSKARRGS